MIKMITLSEEIFNKLDSRDISLPISVVRRIGGKIGDYLKIKYMDRYTFGRLSEISDGDIYISPQLRRELGISLGSPVEVELVSLPPVEYMKVAPIGEPINPDSIELIIPIIIGTPIKKGSILKISESINLKVTDLSESAESEGGYITHETIIEVQEPVEEEDWMIGPSYEDVGGLRDEISKLREMIELPMRFPEIFEHIGVEPPKGILLHGPPGTGKTLLAKALANEIRAKFFSIKGPEIMNKFYGQSEENLRNIFNNAKKNAPSVIFIDEIDSIAPKRDELGDEVTQRVVAQLLSLMDGIEDRGQVIVIGATNRVDSIDEALRRPGRFDRELEIGVPNEEGRFEILSVHTRSVPLDDDVDLREIAKKTYGYVGADLAALVREAAISAIRRVIPNIQSIDRDNAVLKTILNDLKIKKEDFMNAYKSVSPSAMREFIVSIPNVSWDDVGGLNEVKEYLNQSIVWKEKYPNIYKRLKGSPPKGILLYGPPGTGKTLLAKALAHESKANFISVKGPEIMSKWFGESEHTIRKIFKKARQSAPCIVFFDEIDSIAPVRGSGGEASERVVSQLLTEIDGLENLEGVTVIAATNRPDMIDPALLRAGRFDIHIKVDVPNEEERKEILKIHLKDIPIAQDVTEKFLLSLTKDRTGAEIEAICHEASNIAIMRYIKEKGRDVRGNERVYITKDDFERANERLRETFLAKTRAYKRSDLYS